MADLYANFKKHQDRYESLDILEMESNISLEMVFRGPIFGLLLGISISLIIFILELISLYNLVVKDF